MIKIYVQVASPETPHSAPNLGGEARAPDTVEHTRDRSTYKDDCYTIAHEKVMQQREEFIDGRVAGHIGAAVSLKTLSIHVCICPHFRM